MAQLYGRKISLVVGTASGNAVDLSQMHIEFHTRKGIVGTPNTLWVRIWNLSDTTIKKIIAQSNGQVEFSQIVLQAGYQSGPFGTIFTGQVRYYRRGRTSPTDTFLDISAQDGDMAHNYAVVNGSVPPGASVTDLNNLVENAFTIDPAFKGTALAPPNTGITYPRGKVVFGKASDAARDLAMSSATQWSIQDEAQCYIPRQSTLPTVIKVNSATGMLGIPVQTIYGIEVTMLINPNVKFGAQLQLNNSDIQTANLDPNFSAIASNALNQLGPDFLALDGIYKVVAGEYTGDTRGQAWDLLAYCVNLDSSQTPAQAQEGWLPGP